MKAVRSPIWLVSLLVVLALGLAACGDDDDDGGSAGAGDAAATTTTTAASSSEGGGGGQKDPGSRTITMIPATSTSEFLAVSIEQLKKIMSPLGWKAQVCDPNGDVTKMEACMQAAVTQKVDAIVTLSLGGPEIQKGAKAARAAGIPVLAGLVTVTPGFEKQWDGVFADNIINMGKATAKWLEANRKDIPIVGEDVTANWGGHGYIVGLKEQLEAQGMKYKDLRDTDLANIVNSQKAQARAILQANPGPLTFIDYSDFGTATYWSDIVAAKRDKDVTMITRYDDPSTVKLMRTGANVLVQVSRSYEHNFDLVQALLDHFIDNAPFPPASKTVYEPDATVKSIKEFPGGGNEAFPFQPALDAKLAEWGKTYALSK